jgi:phosphoribosyl 1,2-cyclic phosphodiesterase
MMRVTLFGTRGSVAAPGPETVRYGGNTSTVEVRGNDGTVLVLDAGTGIRRLGMQLPPGREIRHPLWAKRIIDLAGVSPIYRTYVLHSFCVT